VIPIRFAPRASPTVGGRRPLQARPLTGGPIPRAKARLEATVASSSFLLFIVSHMAWIAIAAVFAAHLLLAQEEHSIPVRALTAVPAMIFLLEARAFLRDEAGELPFMVLGLLQYYMVFGFGVFFDLKFFDLTGPVRFTPDARLQGAAAVALGAFALVAGGRLGRRVGKDLQPTLLRAVPPSIVPARWDSAFYAYAGATTVVTFLIVFAPGVIPSALSLPVIFAFSFELTMGLALVIPPRGLGPRAAQILLGIGVINGMARGQLDYVFRTGMAYVTGHWAAVQRVSLRVITVIVAIYLVVQPVKHTFREQVWAPAAHGGGNAGATARLDAWESAFSVYFEDQPQSRTEDDSGSAMNRLSELGAVMHAFEVVPNRVDYLEGAGFLSVIYAPIPRFIWPDKPTTRDTVSRYGVAFGRQSEAGANATSVNLPLLVEGYWNFGWIGIVFVCVAVGLWLGFSQKLFAGDHWAMRAMGVANITNVTVGSSAVLIYASIFQTMVGRISVVWAVYWLAKALSGREKGRSAGIVRRPPRAMPSAEPKVAPSAEPQVG
jgi:hypothetical protein